MQTPDRERSARNIRQGGHTAMNHYPLLDDATRLARLEPLAGGVRMVLEV